MLQNIIYPLETKIQTIGGQAYGLAEMPVTPEAVMAAEFTGALAVAQQVDLEGQPFKITEPAKWRPNYTQEEWEKHIRNLGELRKSHATMPEITLQPYIGTLRLLGVSVPAYFALDQLDNPTTAIIPYEPSKSSYFRLYRAEVLPERAL